MSNNSIGGRRDAAPIVLIEQDDFDTGMMIWSFCQTISGPSMVGRESSMFKLPTDTGEYSKSLGECELRGYRRSESVPHSSFRHFDTPGQKQQIIKKNFLKAIQINSSKYP